MFDELRRCPPDQIHGAAARLLARVTRWRELVHRALSVPPDDFVERTLPEYVPEVEPKVFLVEEVPGLYQVVLHHFDAATFHELLTARRIGPHFHHFSFSTRILRGRYVQWLFHNRGSVLEPDLAFDRQVAAPTHSIYTLPHDRFHCVLSPEEDTMSFMVRGPARFKPRPPCRRTAAVEREILERRARMLAAVEGLAEGAGQLLDLEDPRGAHPARVRPEP